MRNATAESIDVAERAWQGRSLTVLRQADTATMRITLEVPIEDGELFVRAVDRAVEAGKGALGPEFDTNGWHCRLTCDWAEGGETSADNLTLLCTQHHRLTASMNARAPSENRTAST